MTELTTSMGRLFAAQGVDDWEELHKHLCDKCPAPLKVKCPEILGQSGLCGGKNLIITMAVDAVNADPFQAQEFASALRKALK